MASEYRPERGDGLPEAPAAAGLYEMITTDGPLVYCSGTTARDPRYKGRLGENISTDEGKTAAAKAALNLLALLKAHLGSLERVEKLLKMTVYIASAPHWEEHSKLADSASATMQKFLQARGKHARTAIGVSSLPGGTCVEIEVIVRVRKHDQ